jgi:hypothetical protein
MKPVTTPDPTFDDRISYIVYRRQQIAVHEIRYAALREILVND